MANATAAATENTFNLEDRPQLASVFFVCLLAAHVYVGARVLALMALRRHLQLQSVTVKIVLAAASVSFATVLALRTVNHALNNACAELVPYSYLVRFGIHISLLCFQLRAFVVLRFFDQFGWPQHQRRRRRFVVGAFVCLSTPACVLCVLMWALRLGIQLQGVCTVGASDGSDQFLGHSAWVWASESYELLFIVANIATEMYLGRSMISLNSKRELWVATRLSTALLVWDTLFRFKAVQALILASTPAGDTRTGLLVAYSVAFACCYVVGMSCLFACSFERTRIKHFRLGLCCGGNPVRLVRLACGCASFEQHELAGYKTLLVRMKTENAKLVGKKRMRSKTLPPGTPSTAVSASHRLEMGTHAAPARGSRREKDAGRAIVTTFNPLTLKTAGVSTLE